MDWVRFLPLALFALRQMPHSDTNLSPFDLVYGFQVRGPLDIMYAGWIDEACCGVAISKRVEGLGMMTDSNMARTKRKKDARRERVNEKRSERCYAVGDQVLLKIPGRSGSFQCSWEGPFQVKEVLSRVKYRIVGPKISAGGRVVHISILKVYLERKVCKIMIAEETVQDSEVLNKTGGLGEELCDGFDQDQLDGSSKLRSLRDLDVT